MFEKRFIRHNELILVPMHEEPGILGKGMRILGPNTHRALGLLSLSGYIIRGPPDKVPDLATGKILRCRPNSVMLLRRG